MRKVSLFALVVVLATLSLGIIACNNKNTTPTAVIPTATATAGAPTFTPVALQVKIDLDNYSYSPSTIVIKQGRPIEIVLHSLRGEHSLTSDDLHIDVPVDASADAKKTIRVDVPGNYTFYSKPNTDKANGMVGNLVVLP